LSQGISHQLIADSFNREGWTAGLAQEQNSPMKPVYGIVGCGSISRFHLEGLRKIQARVAHVVDVDLERARAAAAPFGCRVSTDYRDLIADPEVSVVEVLTPTRFHKEICLEAIAAGKDVVCEKTLANSGVEAMEIVRAVRGGNSLFFTAYMKRFFPAVQKAKELMPSLGTLFSAHVRTFQPWGTNFFAPGDLSQYQWILDNYGGGILKCGGSHMLDLVCFLLGRPSGAWASLDCLPGSQLDRKVTCLLPVSGSLTVVFEAVAHNLPGLGYEKTGLDEFIEITGTEGRLRIHTVTWNKPDTNPALLVHYENSTCRAIEYRFQPVNPFHVQVQQIDGWLQTREQGHPDVVDGCTVDLIISAVERSAATNAPVAIDYGDL